MSAREEGQDEGEEEEEEEGEGEALVMPAIDLIDKGLSYVTSRDAHGMRMLTALQVAGQRQGAGGI